MPRWIAIVVAALAIVAVALSALLVERNGAVRRTARTNQRRVALQLAKTRIAEILSGVETGTGGTFEEYPGFSWSASEEHEEAVRQGGALQLRLITVVVRFVIPGGEDSVKVEVSIRR